jgi:ribosome-associated protein
LGNFGSQPPYFPLRRHTRVTRGLTLKPETSAAQLPAWPIPVSTHELIEAAIAGAAEKIGLNLTVLYCGELIDAFDALVVVSGRNDRQVRAIAEEIERLVQGQGRKPLREEGWSDGRWVALDYGDVIVHVFDEEAREYYDLEHLWSAAPVYRP